jgi:hypothetical protein
MHPDLSGAHGVHCAGTFRNPINPFVVDDHDPPIPTEMHVELNSGRPRCDPGLKGRD